MANLTQNEATALKAWEMSDPDFDVLPFAAIARRSKLPAHLVRRTVRSLARKGLTQFVRGCWTEDGEPAGSGYGLTRVGRDVMNALSED